MARWTNKQIKEEIEKLERSNETAKKMMQDEDENERIKGYKWSQSIYWRIAAYKNVLNESVKE